MIAKLATRKPSRLVTTPEDKFFFLATQPRLVITTLTLFGTCIVDIVVYDTYMLYAFSLFLAASVTKRAGFLVNSFFLTEWLNKSIS